MRYYDSFLKGPASRAARRNGSRGETSIFGDHNDTGWYIISYNLLRSLRLCLASRHGSEKMGKETWLRISVPTPCPLRHATLFFPGTVVHFLGGTNRRRTCEAGDPLIPGLIIKSPSARGTSPGLVTSGISRNRFRAESNDIINSIDHRGKGKKGKKWRGHWWRFRGTGSDETARKEDLTVGGGGGVGNLIRSLIYEPV